MSLLQLYKDLKSEVRQFREEFKDKIPTDEDRTRYSTLVLGKKVHKKMKKMVEKINPEWRAQWKQP